MTVDLVIPESDPVDENDDTQDTNGRSSLSGLEAAVTITAELYGLIGSLIPIHLHIRASLSAGQSCTIKIKL